MREACTGALYQGRRAILLGATGFIGRWVARLLCAASAELVLVVRDRPAAQSLFSRYGICGEMYEADLSDSTAVQRLFHEVRPAITFNLAGYGVDRAERDERMAQRINAELVSGVCRAITEVQDPTWPGQDLVHVGSALEYGRIDGDLREDAVPCPTTLYGQSKLAGTLALQRCAEALGVKAITARLFTVYGPGEQPGRLLPSLLEAAQTGSVLPLTMGTQQRDWTYVEDVAAGLLRLGLTRSARGEIVNLCTGRLASVRCFAETAADILGIAPHQLLFGALPTRAEEMAHAPVSVERLRQLAGWIPATGIADGIRATWDFDMKKRG